MKAFIVTTGDLDGPFGWRATIRGDGKKAFALATIGSLAWRHYKSKTLAERAAVRILRRLIPGIEFDHLR